MRIALIAPPFIPVPPKQYGGTELFLAHLAEGLQARGFEVVVYTNGESSVKVERRWVYERAQWPLRKEDQAELREAEHCSWAVRDALRDCDVIHINSHLALTCARFADRPFVCTLHHAQQPALRDLYARHPEVDYVSISDFQRSQNPMPRNRTIYHGIDLSQYRLETRKQSYLSFIGRIAPVKGTHSAITVAQQAGIPLKIAGEVQPEFQEYFERKIKPHLDGKLIEYIGPANLAAKNELLGHSLAMLFPIHWNEPFGLVMVEAMACGTPVLALPGGSVAEVVKEGVSGHICGSVREMARRAQELQFDPAAIRRYVEQHFSVDQMVEQYAALYLEIGAERTKKLA